MAIFILRLAFMLVAASIGAQLTQSDLLPREPVWAGTTVAEVAAGERFGVMKFGSRMDIFVPVDARITVNVGDRVVGGVTVIAMMAHS